MTYLLIAFVIFVALAPLSHFVPSKAQRRVARMREQAALNGLFVEFRKLPGSDEQRRPSPPGTIFYGLRHRSREEPAKRRCYLRERSGWRELERGRMMPEAGWLAGLPETVLGAETSPDGVGVYWQESGEEEQVSEIARVLKQRCGRSLEESQ